jgi:predicted SAM-dependent methyltransferase
MGTTVSGAAVKVNIGCGLSGVEGWSNLDNSPTITLSRLPFGRKIFKTPAWPRDVQRCDVTKRLPFKTASVRYIYSSHTFEHFTYACSLRLAQECHRVLESGGVLRVVVPDLERIVRWYLADNGAMASHKLLQRLSLSHGIRDLVHPGANHAQMFDERSLCHLLREAGFSDPRVAAFAESKIPDINDVELEQRKNESLYVEAER